MRDVCITVDAEPDCPPYLWTWRGMREGAPWLLDTFRDADVPTTLFVTGSTAATFPAWVGRAVGEGHELACHGMTHSPFPELTDAQARREIEESAALLRRWAAVTSFRAPYLRLPDRHLEILEECGFLVDSSRGRYKPAHWGPPGPTSLARVPASVTSSWLRLPAAIRDPVLRSLQSPVVLFVHPWEFVDLSASPIPWDCRAGTGARARQALLEVIATFKDEGARFLRVDELAGGESGA